MPIGNKISPENAMAEGSMQSDSLTSVFFFQHTSQMYYNGQLS